MPRRAFGARRNAAEPGRRQAVAALNPPRIAPIPRATESLLQGLPPMRMDKLTSRFQPALADAQSLAVGRDHQFIEPAHVLLALLDSKAARVRPLLAQGGRRRQPAALASSAPRSTGCPRWRARPGTCMSPTISTASSMSPTSWRSSAAISSSPASCSCSRPSRTGQSGAHASATPASCAGAVEKAIEEVRGGEKVDDAERRGAAPGAGEIHHRPHRARRVGQARSGHRPRR